MPNWIKHKMEPRLSGEISTTSDMQIKVTLWQKGKEGLKSLLLKVKEESEKVGLKLRSWHPVSSLHSKYMGKQQK